MAVRRRRGRVVTALMPAAMRRTLAPRTVHAVMLRARLARALLIAADPPMHHHSRPGQLSRFGLGRPDRPGEDDVAEQRRPAEPARIDRLARRKLRGDSLGFPRPEPDFGPVLEENTVHLVATVAELQLDTA